MADRTECDILKTQIMLDLFAVDVEQRDNGWEKEYLDNVQAASFACSSPQVALGPDGFPYFALSTPEPYQAFESFCIMNLKDDLLLEEGIGIAINPKANSVEWVFTYGDIVNLHLNKEFYSETDSVEIENVETISKDEEVLVAQPSESYLPRQARNVIRKFLQDNGVQQPQIMMISRKKAGAVIQELAFNLFAEDFSSHDDLNDLMQELSWFLPRHYIILSVPRSSSLAAHFEDL